MMNLARVVCNLLLSISHPIKSSVEKIPLVLKNCSQLPARLNYILPSRPNCQIIILLPRNFMLMPIQKDVILNHFRLIKPLVQHAKKMLEINPFGGVPQRHLIHF